MAEPARRAVAPPEDVPVDPTAIDRAYRLYRAQRRAKIERRRENARARLRFVVTFVLLIALAIVLMLTLWHKIQSVFGL
jgi:predicted nucleic acid-binding Zn ribbon protein